MSQISHEFEFCPTRSTIDTHMNDNKSVKNRELCEFPLWVVPCSELESQEYINIKQELYDSERNYLNYLLVLQKLFIDPLTRRSRIISRQDMRSLFGDLNSIFLVNKELLYSLRIYSTIYEAFSIVSPFLKLYQTYARNYTTSQKVFNKLMGRQEFREFIEDQEADDRCLGIKFSALMIMPVQRIPRYILILKRLHDETSSNIEKRELKSVLKEMSEITGLIESCISDFENGEKIWTIQELLGLKEDIVAPGRRFIKEGSLYKRSHCGEAAYHERIFWLFNDILVYGKRRLGMGPRYECSCIFPLRHCVLDYNIIDGSMMIKCKSHSIIVTSDSYEILKTWYEDINTAIERSRLLRTTLRKESSRQHVKEFKSQIKKKFTKKFVNKTYLYGITNMGEESETFKNEKKEGKIHPSTTALEKSVVQNHKDNKRKRRADTEFDVELEAAVLKRREAMNNDDRSNVIGIEQIISSNSATNQVQMKNCEGYDKQDLQTHSRNITRDGTKQIVARTLTRPEIRKYSYQMITPSVVPSISEVPSVDSSFTESQVDHVIDENRHVPWWVFESTPAEYAKRKEKQGFGAIIRNKCSIM